MNRELRKRRSVSIEDTLWVRFLEKVRKTEESQNPSLVIRRLIQNYLKENQIEEPNDSPSGVP